MPTVPRYDVPTVDANSLPMAQFNAPQAKNFAIEDGQQAMQGMQKLGAVGAALANDAQKEANATIAKDIDARFTSTLNNYITNPDGGYLTKQGKDVVAGHNAAMDDIDKIKKSALAEVKNPAVLKMLDPILSARTQNAFETIDKHTIQETRKYQVQTSGARALVSLQDAAVNFTDDRRFDQAISITRVETASLAKLHGWDESTAQIQAQKFKNEGYEMRYEAWRLSDPAGAFAHFQKNADQISPLEREKIGAHLFKAAAPVLAQQFNQAGGVGVVSASPTEGGASLPRGIRNNNPGNIAKGPSNWQGETQGNDPRYVTFSTPEAGIRAMGKTLINYQDKYNLNTVEAIVSRWAPATENDTASYAATVAKALGVSVGAPIDLHNADTLAKITRAMIKVENGSESNRITDQQITAGLAAATSGAALPTATPSAPQAPGAPTGYVEIDSLPSDWKLHVMQLARSQAHQDMALARESLRGKVQDATAEYMITGMATRPPSEAEFIRAYGQAEGVGHYRDFQNTAQLGQTLQQVKTLPGQALVDLVTTAKPAPGDGFAVRQHNYEILTQAVQQVQKARIEDPVGYALTAKSYGIQPIQRFDDTKAFATELTRRAIAAPQMASDYGTPPQLLTKTEAKALSATIKAAPVEGQKQLLATIYQGVQDMGLFKATMQAIAPDNPTAAVAGIYQARGLKTTENRDVADLILRGQAILTPNTKTDGTDHMGGTSLVKMPESKLLLSDWNAETGDAFKGKEQASDLFQQTAKAIYAAKSAEEGDYSGVLDGKRWKSSIMMATGGIESHNGSQVVMPYGFGYDQFQNALKQQSERILSSGGAFNTTASEMMRLPVENVGDGRYLFRRGAGYLVNKDGRPVVVDLSRGR